VQIADDRFAVYNVFAVEGDDEPCMEGWWGPMLIIMGSVLVSIIDIDKLLPIVYNVARAGSLFGFILALSKIIEIDGKPCSALLHEFEIELIRGNHSVVP
jgi:hypothetical protein